MALLHGRAGRLTAKNGGFRPGQVAKCPLFCDAQSCDQVRETPSWPRSWATFSLLSRYSHGNAWANLHLLGRPDTFLAGQCHPDNNGYTVMAATMKKGIGL